MTLLLLQTTGGTTSPGSVLATGTNVALVALGFLALISVVVLLVLLKQIRDVGRAVQSVAGRLERGIDPVLERARGVATNVEYISAAVRADVEHLNVSVKALSERLRQASDHMEERIDEFNALLQVVQSEAEGMFLDTASTVRGVREGARRLSAPGHPPRTTDVAEVVEE
jgi:uncharacterized protein YoxC